MGQRGQRSSAFLLVFFYVEPLMYLAMHKGGDIISLLWSQAAGIRPGHVVLNKGSHLSNLVRTSAVARGVSSPQGRDRWR
jgi:hypothetical protein